MNKFLLLIAFATGFGPNTENISASEDLTTFLTGNGSKSWSLYSRMPERESATCKATHPISLDNSYVFSSNGIFEFDHGLLIEDVACKSDCCGDLINLVGTWEFTNNQKEIKIIALHEKGMPGNSEAIVLYDATIDQLDENVLKFSQTDPETNIQYVFEFRKR